MRRITTFGMVFTLGCALGIVVGREVRPHNTSAGGASEKQSAPLESLAPGTELTIAHTRSDGTHEGGKVKIARVVGIDRREQGEPLGKSGEQWRIHVNGSLYTALPIAP